MATWLRAAVMLVVLVGLPAAWVYYGPLPPAAVGVLERTVASARQSLGWTEPAPTSAWREEQPKTAPQFDRSRDEATAAVQQQLAESNAMPLPQLTHDAQFSLATATMPADEHSTPAPTDSTELARQLEPHLSLLRSLDAADYTLENWGGAGQLYRFRCSISLGDDDNHTRLFEAIDADPLRAVHQVVGEVTSWQNARQTSPSSYWQ